VLEQLGQPVLQPLRQRADVELALLPEHILERLQRVLFSARVGSAGRAIVAAAKHSAVQASRMWALSLLAEQLLPFVTTLCTEVARRWRMRRLRPAT